MSDITKKNGLLYSDNFHIIVGVDTSSDEFTGRIPFGARAISDRAFAGVNYESISLPESIKHIGFNLFENAAGVKSIRLPGALSELTPYMFAGCASLEKINMPNIVPEFPEHIFEGCSSLKEVPFRTDIAYIGAFAFARCSSIKSLVFPETVQTVESGAFSDCTGLESVVVGSNVSDIADDAFSGCTSVNHIRLSEQNGNFYIGDDGSLFRKSDDALIIKVCQMENQEVSFFEASESISDDVGISENPLDNPVWIDEADDEEDDDTFSAEIGIGTDEELSMNINVENSSIESDNISISEENEADIQNEKIDERQVEAPMDHEDMLASIMNQNTSTKNVDSSVSVNLDEIAGVVSAMNDTNGIYTEDMAKEKTREKNLNILCNSVKYSLIKDYEPSGEPLVSPRLYVIAEKLVTDAAGNETVSQKLMNCCDNLAGIHDLKSVVFISGLPLENDEFVDFFSRLLNFQNVLVACEADSPSTLSDYCKKVCEIADISLDKVEMAEQRKRAGVKNQSIIKLVVQDKY